MYVLDLFSGIGGFSLGLERVGFETVAFCEINPFCRAVLKKHWPSVPCFEDIRALDRASLVSAGVPAIDLISGGYPCQPFSTAGQRRGQADDRHLWPEMFRLIQELRPTWVIGENVAGHISMGLDEVLADLEGANYSARAFSIPACAVGADHERQRLWVIAHSNGPRELQQKGHVQEEWRRPGDSAGAKIATNVDCPRLPYFQRQRSATRSYGRDFSYTDAGRHIKPILDGSVHGIPCRVDRVKSLGNCVHPLIPEVIGHAIKEGLML